MKLLNLIALFALGMLASFARADTNVNAGSEDLEDARLLVVKNILNNYMVETLDVSVKYTIYNIGNSAALSVKLEDGNFPENKFEVVTGFNKMKWSRIPPQSNVTHTLTVKPKISGLFNVTSALVTYIPSEKSSQTQYGYSSDMGELYIMNLRDYQRRFASHTLYWIMFAVLVSPAIALPYFLYFSSKQKRTRAMKNKSKST